MFYKSKHQRTCSEALLGSLVNEQVLQWQGLRQDIVTDVAASDAVTGCQKRSWRSEQLKKPEGVQGDGVPVLDSHLDRLQVGVHCHIHSSDRAMHLIWPCDENDVDDDDDGGVFFHIHTSDRAT